MAPLYKPPTRVTTVSIPYQALVSRVDPSWNRYKFREIEYEFSGKIFIANPYKRGPYDTPIKLQTINYDGDVTLAAGDITNVGFDFISVNSVGSSPGTFTTRTAAQMFNDIGANTIPLQYYIRINNIGGAPQLTGDPITLAAGQGVNLQGNMVIEQNTYSDFIVSFIDAYHLTITTYTYNNIYHSATQWGSVASGSSSGDPSIDFLPFIPGLG